MNRVQLLSTLALAALLSGCATQQPVQQQVPVETPQPVSIHGEMNLTAGVTGQSWSVRVLPGLRAGHATFTLQGIEGQSVREKGSACLHFTAERPTGTTDGSSGECSTGPNLIVQPPVEAGERKLLDWGTDKMTPGTYTFQFNADPQLGRLVVDIAADY